MSDVKKARENPQAAFWEELEDVNAGMLGLEGASMHFQPMAHQSAPDENALYFFTSKSSELVREMPAAGARAHFVVIGEDHDFHACVAGALVADNDRQKIERFWSPVVAAWFAGGKEDPDLTLLRLQLSDGMIWASTDNSIKFGWEIAKANVTDEEPDLGARREVRF